MNEDSTKYQYLKKIPDSILNNLKETDTINLFYFRAKCFGYENPQKISLIKGKDSLEAFLFEIVNDKSKKGRKQKNGIINTIDSLISHTILDATKVNVMKAFFRESNDLLESRCYWEANYVITGKFGTFYKTNCTDEWKGFLFLKRDLFYK